MRFTVFFAVFIFSVFSADRIPTESLYEATDMVPVKIQRKHLDSLREFSRAEGFKDPVYTFRIKNTAVVLVQKSSLPKLDSEGIPYQKSQSYSPFRYYDPTYSERFRKGFAELSDLKTGYKDHKLNEIYLRSLARAFPEEVTYFEIGRTRLGRPIPAIRITSNNGDESKPSVLFNGAHHSNELIGTEHCYDIIFHLLNEKNHYKKYLDRMNIWFIPIVNPDGSWLFWYKSFAMGRKNGYLAPSHKETDIRRGVDINRNYPFKWNSGHPTASSGDINHPFYRGPSPASEPETKAMMEIAESERFLLSMSFHSFAGKILFPYSIEDTVNPIPDYQGGLAKRLVSAARSYSGRNYQAVKNLYPVDGTDQDYFFNKHGTVALLTESTHRNIEFANVEKVLSGFRPAWKKFLEEYFTANKLILRITDREKEPVEAQITIDELEFYEGEELRNNPENGYFHRLMPDDREYTVRIKNVNFQEELVRVRAKKDFTPVSVILKKKK